MTPLARLSPVLTFFAFVACGGATAIVPDDGSGATSGSGGATGSGSVTGAGGKVTGGVTGAGGKPTGGITGAGGKPAGGVTGAGGKPTGGITGAGGKPTGGVTGAGGKPTGGVTGAGGKPTGGVTGSRWAKDYEQSCNFDLDCFPVTEGPACACKSCFDAAINQKEAERWINAAGRCDPLPCDPVRCEKILPACYGGICGVRRVDYIQPGEFDRTCSTQSDCTLVQAGDLCSGCNCEFDAIGLKGLEQYKQRVVNGPSCGSPGPDGICDCAIPQALCRFDGSQSLCTPVY